MTRGRCTRAKRSTSWRRASGLVFRTKIRKTIRYAEAPVQGSSCSSTSRPAGGEPGPRQGGARWHASAPACVRARSPSCSRRQRPREAEDEPKARRRRLRPVDPAEQSRPKEEPSSAQRRSRAPLAHRESLPEPAPQLHRAQQGESAGYMAVIRVVGVGGAGLNAVNRMIDAGLSRGRVPRAEHRHSGASGAGAGADPHRKRPDGGPRLRVPTPISGGGQPRKATTRSSVSCAAPTWSS